MSVGLSFGSATSGTGFDVTSTVTSIMALERAPETAWATQTSTLQSQDTALTTLGSDVAALNTALSGLTSFDGVLSQKQGASADTSIVALTSVGTTAQNGTHSISVQQLATTAQQYSSTIASGATLSGTITLQTASAASATSISIASGATLSSVAAQINNSSAGVRATLVTGSSGSHLILTSAQSGAPGDLTVGGSVQSSDGSAVSFTSSIVGQNAIYTLDGISNLTSSSNAVTGALTGVNFQLVGVSSSTTSTSSNATTIEVASDQSSISTAISAFVKAYNTLNTSLSAQEANDSAGTAEPLYGSTVISEIQSRLASALSVGSSIASVATAALTAPTTAGPSTASSTTLTLGDTSHTVSGTLALAIGSGTAHSIAVPTGSTLSALASQINADTAYSAAGITAAYDSGSGALTITGPIGVAATLTTSGTYLQDNTPATTSNMVSLSSLGLTMGTDGNFTLDTSTLATTLSNNMDGVIAAFQIAGNFGQSFLSALNNSGSTGQGTIALALKENSDQESTLATNKANLELRLATYQTSLTTELTTANQILQQIPQQLAEIKQMFEAITGNSSS